MTRNLIIYNPKNDTEFSEIRKKTSWILDADPGVKNNTRFRIRNAVFQIRKITVTVKTKMSIILRSNGGGTGVPIDNKT